jgi:hypothetical protein
MDTIVHLQARLLDLGCVYVADFLVPLVSLLFSNLQSGQKTTNLYSPVVQIRVEGSLEDVGKFIHIIPNDLRDIWYLRHGVFVIA